MLKYFLQQGRYCKVRKPAFICAMDMENRLRGLRHVALDLDGTLHKDGLLFACTLPFLEQLKSLGIGWTFLTNNCSRSTREYVGFLQKNGIPAEPKDVYSSAHATLEYLRSEMPEVKRLFVLGTKSLARELEEEGFMVCGLGQEHPDAVVVAFDTGLTYERLCKAAYWIDSDTPFLATHPDTVCPTDLPTVLVDCGSICAALERATGRVPVAVLGKPDPLMLQGLMKRRNVRAAELAMVGDRLYTDIAMAKAAGVLDVLVLSGETSAAAATAAAPTLVVDDVGELGNRLADARKNI